MIPSTIGRIFAYLIQFLLRYLKVLGDLIVFIVVVVGRWIGLIGAYLGVRVNSIMNGIYNCLYTPTSVKLD